MNIKFLETDEQFIQLLPLVMAFSLKTKMPVSHHIREVAESITNPSYLTQFGVDSDDLPIRYLCGYHLNETDFMLSQAFSQDNPSNTLYALKVFEEELHRRKITKIVMMTYLNPRIFRRLGFKFERFLLTKELK